MDQLPLGIRILKGGSLIKKSDNLTKLRRGRQNLFIEKESASWIVLEGASLALFNFINRPMTVNEIVSNTPSSMTHREKEELLTELFKRNMITINGLQYFDLSTLWDIPVQYPQFLCFHITDSCNFVCKYCYAYARPHLKTMPKEVSHRVVERILEEIPHENFLLDFHGGEPFMAFDEMVDTIKYAHSYNKEKGLNKKLDFYVQTNGSLVTVEKAKLLNSLNCKIGFSLDGPEEIQNQQRIYPDGLGTFQKVWENSLKLKEAGINVGYLAVLHNPENYKKVFQFFVDQGLRGFRLNYSAYIGRATEELDFPHERAETFARHYLEMVDAAIEFVERTGESLNIKDLDSQINNIMFKKRPFMCYRSPCGCGKSILGFGHEGGIYACEEATAMEEFRIGSIFDDSQTLTEMIDNNANLKKINSRTVDNIPKCKECTFKRFCGGRCTTKSFARYGRLDREDPMCRFYQIIYPELIWRIVDKPHIVNLLSSEHAGSCQPPRPNQRLKRNKNAVTIQKQE